MVRLGRFLSSSWPRLYVCAFSLLIVGYLLYRPIVAYDADLWYHLNAGRYIFEHHAVPDSAFFSFLTPPRAWLDYYWLFQALVFALYSWSGYFGLIVLRAAVFAATAFFIGQLLLVKDGEKSRAVGALLASLYLFPLTQRFLLVRPHLFSYLGLVAMLQILESKPRWLAGLPLVAVFWVNLHGGSYPVLVLILLAYVGEEFLRRRPLDARRRNRLFIFSTLSLAAIFATPLGAKLLPIPFISTDYASRIINEFRPIRWQELAYIRIKGWTIDYHTAFNLLLAASGLALLAAAARKSLRLSHLALWMGGLLLLRHGERFRYECALLSLPLLRAHLAFHAAGKSDLLPKPAGAVALAALLALPVLSVGAALPPRERYPFSRRQLPVGIAAFLRQADAGGSVLIHPLRAAYLEWSLCPRYRVGADMQFPYLFSDADYYIGDGAFRDPRLLRLIVSRYHPDFIAAPMTETRFPEIIRPFADYAPIFFDDEDALYVNRRRHPALAKSCALAVDPFHLPLPPPAASASRITMPPFLTRMIAIDPGCLKTRGQAAIWSAAAGDFPGELRHAQAIIDAFPEVPYGYQLKDQALGAMGSLARK